MGGGWAGSKALSLVLITKKNLVVGKLSGKGKENERDIVTITAKTGMYGTCFLIYSLQ